MLILLPNSLFLVPVVPGIEGRTGPGEFQKNAAAGCSVRSKRRCKRRYQNAFSAPRATSCERSAHAHTVIFCCLLCSAKASLEMARTRSKPSRPLAAFLLNLSTVTSSMLFLIFCHPPHIAMTLAVWSKIVLPGVLPGMYRTVSCTDRSSLHVKFWEHIVTDFSRGLT